MDDIIINGIKLRINPTDILVIDNRNPETVPMIRTAKTFTYPSRFSKGTVQIVFQFDINNQEDRINIIKLCTYMDLYPYMFIKSDLLVKYTHHTYDSIFDHQIYGINEYSIEVNSRTQGVYILAITLTYFNYIPFAYNLFFFNLQKDFKETIDPTTKEIVKVSDITNIEKIDIEKSELFTRFFSGEIASRISKVEEFLLNKGTNHIGIKYPQIITEEMIIQNNINIKKEDPDVEIHKYEIPKSKEDIEHGNPAESPLKETYALFKWEDILNPLSEDDKFNLNTEGSQFQTLIITKRNNIALHSMTSYTHPVLQYMGKGQADIQIQIASNIHNIQPQVITLIKSAISKIDINNQQFKQVAVFNVLKLDSLLTCISPIFGLTLSGEKSTTNSENQGIEIHELYLLEQDNRELLRNSQFQSSGAKAGIDIDTILEALRRANNYVYNESTRTRKPFQPPGSIDTNVSKTQLDRIKELEKKYNLPSGLLYGIYGQESRFGKLGTSPTGAKGPFQFIASTGYQFGLNSPKSAPFTFDYRDDFYKSSEAAANYLGYLHRLSKGDTKLTIAAYNAGEGTVLLGWTDRQGVHHPPLKYDVLDPNRKNSKNGRPGETLEHNQRVLAFMAQFNSGQFNGIDKKNIDSILDEFTDKDIRELRILLEDTADSLDNVIDEDVFQIGDEDILGNWLIKSEEILNNPDYKYQYKSVLEKAYIGLARLAANGNSYAQAALAIKDVVNDVILDQLEDKFRDEGVSDLKFSEYFPKETLIELNLKDFRDIPPFFFLGQRTYITEKEVTATFDIVGGLLQEDTSTNDMLAKERQILVKYFEDLEASANDTTTSTGKIIKADTSYDDVKLAKGLNTGNKTEIDEVIQGNIFNQPTDDIDPLDVSDIVKKQAESVSSYFKYGLNLAFPVLKVYIVEGDETNFSEHFRESEHLYYELNGIIECSITTNDDENPVDILHMVISNPGSVYTDRHVLLEKYKPQTDYKKLNTEAQNKFILNNIQIRPGIRLHIRAGYGNNPNNMEPIFNGIITGVGGEHVLEVIAEGFGRELQLYKHGDDPTENGFLMNANTKSILANALNAGEVEHFGNFTLLGTQTKDNEAKRLITSSSGTIFNMMKYTNKYDNIFLKQIEDHDDAFNSLFFNFIGAITLAYNLTYEYPLFKTTPWQMLKEMEYRHPGAHSRPALYESRHSYFFGLKEQLYVAKQVDPILYSPNKVEPGVGILGYFGIKSLEDYLFNLISGHEPRADALYLKVRKTRFKPICNLHIATSEQNIIKNNIKLSEDFSTVVNVAYADLKNAAKKDFSYYEIKVDDNLRPSAHRQMDLSMPGINDKATAVRYGAVALRKELGKMYDGELILFGNPKIKAYDMIYIIDQFRNMRGFIEVREVVHKWSIDEGYITIITPGLFVQTSFIEYPLFRLFPALGGACSLLAQNACDIAQKAEASSSDFKVNSFILDNLKDIYNEPDFKRWINAGIQGAIGGALSHDMLKSIFNGSSRNATSFIGRQISRVLPNPIIKGANLVRGTTELGANIVRGFASTALESLETFSARFGLTRLAGRFIFGAIRLAAIDNPLTAAVALIATSIAASVNLDLKARQPVRIYPLTQNDLDYLAGIYGYRENGYFEALTENISNTFKDTGILINALKAAGS